MRDGGPRCAMADESSIDARAVHGGIRRTADLPLTSNETPALPTVLQLVGGALRVPSTKWDTSASRPGACRCLPRGLNLSNPLLRGDAIASHGRRQCLRQRLRCAPASVSSELSTGWDPKTSSQRAWLRTGDTLVRGCANTWYASASYAVWSSEMPGVGPASISAPGRGA